MQSAFIELHDHCHAPWPTDMLLSATVFSHREPQNRPFSIAAVIMDGAEPAKLEATESHSASVHEVSVFTLCMLLIHEADCVLNMLIPLLRDKVKQFLNLLILGCRPTM